MEDMISRKMAIEALKEHRNLFCDNTPETFSKLSYAEKSRVDELDMAIATLINLPSAQPETHDKRTETHACDLISRQAAIDAVMEFMPSLTTPDGCGQFDREIFEAQEMFVDIGQALNELPTAQPEQQNARIFQGIIVEYPSISTYPEYEGKPYFSIKYTENGQDFIGYGTYKPDVLSEYLKKYFIPSAQPDSKELSSTQKALDTISRQAAIDAHYEYCNKHPDAGFPVWSLKILKDLPSADLSGYSDKLWKAAYERGRAEALAEIVRRKDCKHYKFADNRAFGFPVKRCEWTGFEDVDNDNFCSRAERREDA